MCLYTQGTERRRDVSRFYKRVYHHNHSIVSSMCSTSEAGMNPNRKRWLLSLIHAITIISMIVTMTVPMAALTNTVNAQDATQDVSVPTDTPVVPTDTPAPATDMPAP